MTNPSDYGWYGLTPPELPGQDSTDIGIPISPKQELKGMFFNHEIPPEEKEMHIADRCCECIPFIDPESDYHTYVHNRISLLKPGQGQL